MKRAIISNLAGTLINLIFSLITVPIQIRLLGVEAFGLVGFIASLQIILVLLDFGLSSSVVREIAANHRDDKLNAAIIQTSATVYWAVATVVGIAVFMSADWISVHWLNSQTLTPDYLAGCVRIIAAYMILTWPVGHYANVLFALKRLDLVNGLRIFTSFTSQFGGIVLIYLTRDVAVFLMWLALNALLSITLHMSFVRRVFDGVSLLPGISRQAVGQLWHTAFNMNIVSSAATIYTQLDKLLISSLLPLSQLGYYNVAYRLMVASTLIPVTIGGSILPTMTEQFARGAHHQLTLIYNRVTQLMLYIMSGFAFGLIFWGQDVIRIWTSAETASNAYQVLGLLSLGALLNTVTILTYQLLLATGHSRILRNIYGYGMLPYGLCQYWLIVNMGLIGAALGLLLYSVYFIVTLLVYTSRHITHESVIPWLNRNLTVFTLLGVGIFGAGRWLLNVVGADSNLVIMGMGLLCGIAYFAVGFLLLYDITRVTILDTVMKRYRAVLKPES